MKLSSMKIMVTLNLIGNLIVISSSSWLMIWFGLELMSLTLPSMIILSNTSLVSKINAWKYFMIQCYSSAILFMSVICLSYPISMDFSNIQWSLVIFSLLIKMGIIPFLGWLVQISSSISWSIFLIMSSIQKIGPLFAMSEMMSNSLNDYSLELMLSCLVSFLSITGILIKSVRLMMISSSMINSAWIFAAMYSSKYMFVFFLLFYIIHIFVLLNIFMQKFSWSIDSLLFISKKDFFIDLMKMLVILSLVGIPPLVGFYMKVSVLGILIMENQFFSCFILTLSSAMMMIMYLSFVICTIVSLSIEKTQFKIMMSCMLSVLLLMGMFIFFYN